MKKNTEKKVFFIVLSFVQLLLIGQLFRPIKLFFFSNLFKKIPGNLSIFELKIKKLYTSKTISDFIDLLIFCYLQKRFFKDCDLFRFINKLTQIYIVFYPNCKKEEVEGEALINKFHKYFLKHFGTFNSLFVFFGIN